MTISVYAEFLAYRFGGTESYTAALLEVLQSLFPDSCITVVTESLKNSHPLTAGELVDQLNKAFGTSISKENLSLSYFNFGKKMPSFFAHGIRQRLSNIILNKKNFSRIKKIASLAEGSDLFINTSFLLIPGAAKENLAVIHFPLITSSQCGFIKRTLKNIFYFGKIQNLENRFALTYDRFLPNSEFTASWLKRYWNIPAEKITVLYPPVNAVRSSASKNKNQILVCSKIARIKCIDKLVEAYKNSPVLKEKASLVVAGSVLGVDKAFVKKLQAIEPSVRFVFDPSREELENLYAESGIFWHAKGLGSNNPLDFEHFGMTTVEAMSAGCIPVVINKGGQKEIVTEDCGLRWDSIEEMVQQTERIVLSEDSFAKMRECSSSRSLLYCKESFKNRFETILSDLDVA